MNITVDSVLSLAPSRPIVLQGDRSQVLQTVATQVKSNSVATPEPGCTNLGPGCTVEAAPQLGQTLHKLKVIAVVEVAKVED